MELLPYGNDGRSILSEIKFSGEKIPVEYIESTNVTEGVRCDVYKFINDDSKDLGVIFIEPGCKTPLQKVLKGDRTIESFVNGKGNLTVITVNGEKRFIRLMIEVENFLLKLRLEKRCNGKQLLILN